MSNRKRHQPKPDLAYDLDIVIPVHGNFELLKRTVDALPEACGDVKYKVIIFDNGSPKEETEVYPEMEKSSNIRIIRNKENIGFPKACNRGVTFGRSNLILHLNSDCIMHPGSIKKLVDAMNDPSVGIVAPMLVFPSEQEYMDTQYDNFDFTKIRPAGQVQHVGLETNINGDFYHIFVGWSPDHYRVTRMESPYAVTGACLMTRRQLWIKVGGFWEGYGQGTYEDIELCMAVKNLGYNIRVLTDAVGTHYVGATAFKYNLPMPLNENKQLFLQRHGNRLEYTEWRHL